MHENVQNLLFAARFRAFITTELTQMPFHNVNL